MGVVGAWDGIEPTMVLPLREWCQKFLEKHQRLPVIAVDISNHIYQVSTEKKSQHEGIEHMQLARRLLGFMALGCTIVCVFDGPMNMEKRRHAASGRAQFLRQASPMVAYAKTLAQALHIPVVEAKAEAEAQCAALQLRKQVDVAFTSDADILANGATRILRYDLSSSGAGQTAGLRIVKYYELEAHLAPVFALESMLLGNDWVEGVKGIGRTIARAISQYKTGFAVRLAEISAQRDDEQIAAWCHDFCNELKTNKHKWLTKRCNSQLPADFPALNVLEMLLRPDVRDIDQCAWQSTCLPQYGDFDYFTTLRALRRLWFQPSPNFGGNHKTPAPLTSIGEGREKQLLSFENAVAPATLVSLLVRDAPSLQQFVFKRVENSKAVEVVSCPAWAQAKEVPMNPKFLVGARVPGYLTSQKVNVRFNETVAPKALRNNSTLDSFLGLRINASANTLAAPKAARSQSSPAALMTVTNYSSEVLSGRYDAGKSTKDCISIAGSHERRPLDSVKTNRPFLATTGTKAPHPPTKARIARRSRSKLSSTGNDTRVECYFQPASSLLLHSRPIGKVPVLASRSLSLRTPSQQVINLTQDLDHERSDSDTDVDDDTPYPQPTKASSASQWVSMETVETERRSARAN